MILPSQDRVREAYADLQALVVRFILLVVLLGLDYRTDE